MTEYNKDLLQTWKIGNTPIYSRPNNIENGLLKNYVFMFYQNGYQILFDSNTSFSDGMKMVMDAFFNGAKLSNLQQN